MSKQKRSATGHHTLLPASSLRGEEVHVPLVPTHNVISWTFGRGTVIWSIWPAFLLHTFFAAVITVISLKTKYYLGVPQVLITVLGVVIGFVIAYRASSGYDRYWMGRVIWSDLAKTSRTMGRLIWFHVPLKNTPHEQPKEEKDINRLMREKRLALDLIEGFVVATKHHLRGEMGYYYEDLYHLLHPLHNHPSGKHAESRAQNHELEGHRNDEEILVGMSLASSPPQRTHLSVHDPFVPAINDYGTFDPDSTPPSPRRRGRLARRASSSSCASSGKGQNHPPLLPSQGKKFSSHVITELIPFASILPRLGCRVQNSRMKGRNAPKVAGGGQNIPLEIIRCLSEWLSVLDERATVSGNPLGGMYGCLTSFEDSLSALERILTTPLPFIYSAHISAVWLYLFLLPFQLVGQFGWFTIPGVGIAAFFYIGFLAAGEEIEQPFGYDDNDLDLDLFCREIVHADIESLKRTPCPNVRLPARHSAQAASSVGGIMAAAEVEHGNAQNLAEVFGSL